MLGFCCIEQNNILAASVTLTVLPVGFSIFVLFQHVFHLQHYFKQDTLAFLKRVNENGIEEK